METGRVQQKLNLDWRFFRGDDPKAWYKGYDDAGWREVTLPHDWSVAEPFSPEHSSGTGYLPGGTGWYRKSFMLPEEWKGKRISITFEGVYNNAQVWCNSYYLGKRPYGYSTFSYDITDFAVFGETQNVISVRVDHRYIADSRWFTGSGIYRDVYLTVTDPVHFVRHGVFVSTPEVSVERAEMDIDLRILNGSAEPAALRLNTVLIGQNDSITAAAMMTKVLQSGEEASFHQMLSISHPDLWSPEDPILYTLQTEIIRSGQIVDQLRIPVGIRWFSFEPEKGFIFNGVNRKIKGVCVHHDAGCLGAAVPEKVWARRLKTLKEMGCNAIRMSHNPPAPNLLELCDRMGFFVMDEAFDEWEGVKNKWAVGHNVYPPSHYGYYEDFPQWAEADIKEMVLRDRNHPSIILWSIGNEVDYPNDPYCHPLFDAMTGNNDANKPAAERLYDPNKPNAERLVAIAKRLVQYVKECDMTRPVTTAAAFPELSNLTGFTAAVDVVGYNYKEQWYREDHEKYPGRVIYGSENSPGLEEWLAVRDNDFISGQFIWTGVDFLGEAKGWPVRVAQPGFLDLTGGPKAKYYYRKSMWTDEPMVRLTTITKADPDYAVRRQWAEGEHHWNWQKGEPVEAICYTNCEEVELFLNGRSLGVKKLTDASRMFLSWEIPFEAGLLKALARSNDGRTCGHEIHTAGSPQKVTMKADDGALAAGGEELVADGQDIMHIEIGLADGEGLPVMTEDRMLTLNIDGPGEIIGIENGDASDLTPYSSRARSTYKGRLLVYIRSRIVAGTITVKAEADGLEAAEIKLTTQ